MEDEEKKEIARVQDGAEEGTASASQGANGSDASEGGGQVTEGGGGAARPMPPNNVYSPSDVRALLHAFYSKVNPAKLPSVDEIVEEMETRIARASGGQGVRRREVVYSELTRLNQRLRETYGQDLSLVVHQHQHQRQPPPPPQPLSAASIIIFALCLGMLAPAAHYAWEVMDAGASPHMHAFPPHKQSGWRQSVRDSRVTLDVSLEDLYKGKSGTVSFRRQTVCSVCHGSGAASSQMCRQCGGHGHSVARSPFGLVRMECSTCGGHGWVPVARCSKCGGHGVFTNLHEVAYHIPPGSVGGSTITLRGQGDEAPHANSGDLTLEIHELAHSRFRREGADLHTDVYLTLEEALLGWSRDIEHLDGEVLTVSTSDLKLHDGGADRKHQRVTPMGSSLRIPGKGMSARGGRGRGHLVVHLKVQIPELTSRQADKIQSILA